MAAAVEDEVAQLRLEVASLREEGEIVRKMWAADVDRLSVELSQARASASGSADPDPTRELFLELERMEVALVEERQRASVLIEEKAARDSDIKSLQLALERSNALLERKAGLETQSKPEVESLESTLTELMGDLERVEAKNRALVEEVWTLKNSGVVGSSLIFAAEKKGMLMAQETGPSTPRSCRTGEEPELEHSLRSLEF